MNKQQSNFHIMTEFHTIEDVTEENIQKALEEIKRGYKKHTSENFINEVTSFNSQEELIQFYRNKGYVTIEEYMENARNKYGL